ncbi:MAG: transposase [Acetobacteraceae bacterium]|nr:transposase [Acetobacteraceae bacterium]
MSVADRPGLHPSPKLERPSRTSPARSSVDVAFADQRYGGQKPAEAAAQHGIQLEVVTLPEARQGVVLLPGRRVVERSFAWATRFRRLVRDYERLPQTVAGLHFIGFACLVLHRAALAYGQ